MNIVKQKEKISKLLELIKEYPDHEIVPMVATDCVCDDSFGYWMSTWGNTKVTKYWISDDRVYHYDDFEDLVDEWIDDNHEEYPGMSDYELEEKAEEYVNSLDWTDAIVVYIDSM